MPFSLAIKPSVLKDLGPIPKDLKGKIALAILGLSDNPYPPAAQKLAGSENTYRVRVGDYRVLYDVSATERVVRVLLVAHRREAYR